jgi:membrane-bound ClpP family serine protease
MNLVAEMWVVGIAAIAISWFVPGAGGFFWLGIAALIVGTLFGFRSGR